MKAQAPALLAIFGPTGSGKTGLACALADQVRCHLISCDALQVYRDLNAATEKPRGEEGRHSWALVDWVEPEVDFNLGDWVRAAGKEVRWAWSVGRLPVVAGGTGMYLRGLLKGIATAPGRVPAIRARLAGLSAKHGVSFLHRVLRRLDPGTAGRLGPNDRQRLVRALEVRLVGGSSLAGLQNHGWDGPDRFPVLRVGLELPRPVLYERIEGRVRDYLNAGLVAEVRWLREVRGLKREANAFRALGYRETLHWLEEEGPGRRTEDDLGQEIAIHTRHYAKRQMTWFRREPQTLWVDPREPGLACRLAGMVKGWQPGPDYDLISKP